MKLSKMLFVRVKKEGSNEVRSLRAFIFKHGDEYQKGWELLYFCNWAGEAIDCKDGQFLYAEL